MKFILFMRAFEVPLKDGSPVSVRISFKIRLPRFLVGSLLALKVTPSAESNKGVDGLFKAKSYVYRVSTVLVFGTIFFWFSSFRTSAFTSGRVILIGNQSGITKRSLGS